MPWYSHLCFRIMVFNRDFFEEMNMEKPSKWSKDRAWPVPNIVRCLDDDIGTIARPLTRQLYLQVGLRHLTE